MVVESCGGFLSGCLVGSLDFLNFGKQWDFPLDPREVELFAEGSTATKFWMATFCQGYHGKGLSGRIGNSPGSLPYPAPGGTCP